MNYPHTLPVGTLYPSAYYGVTVPSEYESTLTYRWGPSARPYYVIPILNGLVCEWVPAESITDVYLEALRASIPEGQASPL